MVDDFDCASYGVPSKYRETKTQKIPEDCAYFSWLLFREGRRFSSIGQIFQWHNVKAAVISEPQTKRTCPPLRFMARSKQLTRTAQSQSDVARSCVLEKKARDTGLRNRHRKPAAEVQLSHRQMEIAIVTQSNIRGGWACPIACST